MERLGGPFDYAQFNYDLGEIASDLNFIKKEFRN
jgi:hypothetical protein